LALLNFEWVIFMVATAYESVMNSYSGPITGAINAINTAVAAVIEPDM
jgi:hypothetical protein